MLRLVPHRLKNSEGRIKRLAKAAEGLLNYIKLMILILAKRPDTIHFQWFPFMEFCSVDNFYVSLVKLLRPSQKIVLTVHNVYPHNMEGKEMIVYRKRFMEMKHHIDYFIVHTEASKREIEKEFGVSDSSVNVVPHGIFIPDYTPKHTFENGCHIIMYGNNSPYKGTDILLDAAQLLPQSIKEDLKISIVGQTSADYLATLKAKALGMNVNFNPAFIPDGKLYEMIDQADYIALPYRRISQSGVLLLALYFRKPLLLSDLPSFKETMKGFTDDMFFEAGNAQALCELIMRHLDGTIDHSDQISIINELNNAYSWTKSAQKTLEIYEA